MHARAAHDRSAERIEDALVRDPVCGMTVDLDTSSHRAEHAGKVFQFCSARCRERFERTPEQFLSGGEPPSAQTTNAGAIYTCPMHPEVRQQGPGSCPICGMALEPEIVTGDEGPSEEYLVLRFER